MPGLGVGLAVIGYGLLFAVYQKTWGDGGSVLYWITGAKRFPGPAQAQRDTTGGAGSNPDVVSGANNQGGQGPPGGRH